MKVLTVILLSTFKFGMTFPLAIMVFHFGFVETVIWTNIGGILGVFFFGFLSRQLINLWSSAPLDKLRQRLPRWHRKTEPQQKRRFTRRNRRIVSIRKNYGLPGIALATPILFSIPLGVFLAVRYFGKRKFVYGHLLLANFLWSLAYAAFYGYFYETWLRITSGL